MLHVYFNQATTNLQGADYRHGSLLATFAGEVLDDGRRSLFLPVIRRVNSKIYYIVKSGSTSATYDCDSSRGQTKTVAIKFNGHFQTRYPANQYRF